MTDETTELRQELRKLLDKYGLWAVAYCLQHLEEPTEETFPRDRVTVLDVGEGGLE